MTVVIWEAALINPPEDPFHCPPGVVWVHFVDRGRVSKLRLYHPRRAGKKTGGRSNFPAPHRILRA